jgi:hypothetical protein
VRLNKCKPFILLFCLLLSFTISLSGTLSWFTASDTRTNSLKTPPEKGFMINLVDVFEGYPEDDKYNKRVGAANTDEKDAFVRLLVIPTIYLDDNAAANEGVRTVLPAVFGVDVIIEDLNTADWLDGGDGYYYYKHILAGKTSTDDLNKNLFNQVSISPALLAAYPFAHVMIEVKLEGVGTAPANEYRESWWDWDGVPPTPLTAPLQTVDAALQAALAA